MWNRVVFLYLCLCNLQISKICAKNHQNTQYFETQLIDQSECVFIAGQLPGIWDSLPSAETALFRKFIMNFNDLLILMIFLIAKV